MNSFSKFIIALSIINIISCESQCLETSSPPQEITIDESKTIIQLVLKKSPIILSMQETKYF